MHTVVSIYQLMAYKFACISPKLNVFFPLLQGDTSGDYRKALLLLCGGDDA